MILDYNKLKEDNIVLTGVVAAAQESNDEESSNDVLFIADVKPASKKINEDDYKIEGENEPLVVMFRDRIGIIYQRGPLTRFVGNKITFKIEDTNTDENGNVIVYASLRAILEERREKTIAELEAALNSGETTKATIKRLKNNCAYLESANKTPLIMRQRDFSSDWTAISDVYNVGDVIDVMLANVSEGKRIFVRMPELYESKKLPVEEVLEKYQPNMSIDGKIVDIKVSLCFVRIAPGLDVLCPIPQFTEIKKGMEVKVRLTQVRANNDAVKMRGKIMGELDHERYVLDCVLDD